MKGRRRQAPDRAGGEPSSRQRGQSPRGESNRGVCVWGAGSADGRFWAVSPRCGHISLLRSVPLTPLPQGSHAVPAGFPNGSVLGDRAVTPSVCAGGGGRCWAPAGSVTLCLASVLFEIWPPFLHQLNSTNFE